MIQHKIYFIDATYNKMYEDGYLGNANIVFEKALNREEIFDIRIQKNFYIVDEDLKQRIDKAIEYCEKELNDGRSLENQWLMGCYDTCKELLNILKGEEDENK